MRTCLSISPPIRCHLKGSARYLFFPEVLRSSGICGLYDVYGRKPATGILRRGVGWGMRWVRTPPPPVAGEFRLARKMFPNSFTKVTTCVLWHVKCCIIQCCRIIIQCFALLFNKYILSFNACAFIFNIYNCHSMHFHLYSMYPIIIRYIRICIQCSKLLFDKIIFIFNVLYYYSIFKFDSIILISFAMLQFMFERNAMVIQ